MVFGSLVGGFPAAGFVLRRGGIGDFDADDVLLERRVVASRVGWKLERKKHIQQHAWEDPTRDY